jgi:hypothetical protein
MGKEEGAFPDTISASYVKRHAETFVFVIFVIIGMKE